MNDSFVLNNLKLPDGRLVDIAIAGGRIARVTDAVRSKRTDGGAADGIFASACEACAAAASAADVRERAYDCAGLYVSSGWIDLHVHAFPEFDPYGDEIDEIGIRQGVTTIVDAGSCGADRIADLAASGIGAKTNLLAFLNISRVGLSRFDELSRLEWIDRDRVAETAWLHRGFIVGLKARISRSVVGGNGIEPLRIARELSKATGLRLMVHIGSAPPAIEEVLALLASGDIVTHYLNGKPNNLFDAEGRPIPALLSALGRGVRLDVGHGTASFSFRVAEAAQRHGIGLQTISSDLYRNNRLKGPVYSLANVMTKFLCLGYPLEEVVAAVTSHTAEWLRKPELGRIRVGDTARLTLFEMRNEAISLIDSEGTERKSNLTIAPRGVVIDGQCMECKIRA